MRTTLKLGSAVAALTAASALLLTGCGGSSDNAGVTSDAGNVAAVAAPSRPARCSTPRSPSRTWCSPTTTASPSTW